MIGDTIGCRKSAGALLLAVAVFCLLPFSPAAAMSAHELFEDGNRLYRDDLYWAALLRYRQADEAGMDTALLHYNTGVAHYRAQQHVRARESLQQAARSPDFRVLSHYNLGLNAYAAGDIDEALKWFRQARDQEENAKISKLARIAISRLSVEKKAEDPILVRAEKRRKKKPFATLDLKARVGFGSDDNVFRAPSDPYLDQSDPTAPLVTPEVQSGAFLPVDFVARYDVNSLKYESFFGQYRLSGRLYQDEEIEDANEISHELRFGSEFDRETEDRSTRVYSAFTIAKHDETYVDPDDGTPRNVAGEIIDERLNYVRYGPELAVMRRYTRFAIGLRIKGQLWDYEDTELVPEYDHEYFRLGTNMQYKFGPTSLLRFTADAWSRRYSDRPSFDLNGNQLITNPALRYDYLELGLMARQRITRNMWFGFGYKMAERSDDFQGYNDYTRDTYSFQYHWSPGRRFEIDLKSYYRIYDYPNAFAFHNPAAGPKTLETADTEFTATFRFNRNLSLTGEVDYCDVASTDTRIQYDRVLFSIGVVWQQ